MQQANMFNKKPLEADVQRACLEFLSWKQIFHWRQNSAVFKNEQTGSYIRAGVKGISDIIAIYPGGRMWLIEVKRPGGLLSDTQIEFLSSARQRGAIVTIAESVDDLTRALASPDSANLPRYEKALASWSGGTVKKSQV